MADVSDRSRYCEKRQLNLQTGSYYRELTDDEVLDYSYAARWGHPPKPIGGVFLFLRPEIDVATGDLVVTQDFASDIVVPWKRPRKSA